MYYVGRYFKWLICNVGNIGSSILYLESFSTISIHIFGKVAKVTKLRAFHLFFFQKKVLYLQCFCHFCSEVLRKWDFCATAVFFSFFFFWKWKTDLLFTSMIYNFDKSQLKHKRFLIPKSLPNCLKVSCHFEIFFSFLQGVLE